MTLRNGKIRILVVEDQPAQAMMMAYLLTQAGCQVQTAWNAKRGLKLAQTRGFELIVLNVNLSGINGFQICRRLKENPFFQTPIVLVSDRPSERDMQCGFDLGVVDYIAKPFDALDFAPRLLSYMKAASDSLGMMENTIA